ncbi:MAG: host-nuclease inhibitor Gam family protein [Ignavibacteriota bacterium]
MIDSKESCNAALHRLLKATLRYEQLVAVRDTEIAAIQKQHSPSIATAVTQQVELSGEIETYYLEHREELQVDGKKSIQLSDGVLGMRAPTNPALIPLNDKWTWEKIEAKLRELWKAKYFHKPKAPAHDKVKIKRDMDTAGLKECGMKLDDREQFFLELNRLADADEQAHAA